MAAAAAACALVAVFAPKEQQRFPALDVRLLDFPHNHRVVPRHMCRNHAAAQLHDRVFQDGNALCCPAIAQSQPVLRFGMLLGLRKIFRNRLLPLLQHADPEVFFPVKQRQDFCAFIHANQDQHGI